MTEAGWNRWTASTGSAVGFGKRSFHTSKLSQLYLHAKSNADGSNIEKMYYSNTGKEYHRIFEGQTT
jgi:hypothetical protein